jgi:hypothetical protein
LKNRPQLNRCGLLFSKTKDKRERALARTLSDIEQQKAGDLSAAGPRKTLQGNLS